VARVRSDAWPSSTQLGCGLLLAAAALVVEFVVSPLLGPLFSSSSFAAVNRGLFVGFAIHLGERTKGAVCFVADGRLLLVLGRATVDEPELKSGELS
jgi:hypothetical protein